MHRLLLLDGRIDSELLGFTVARNSRLGSRTASPLCRPPRQMVSCLGQAVADQMPLHQG
jgi:hypothetical protein